MRIPLTTAPRYVRSDEATSRHAQGQPLGLLRNPGHKFSLNLAIRDAATVTSPTHELNLSKGTDATQVTLLEGEVIPDRDCILCWKPWQENTRPAVSVWVHEDNSAGYSYFLALVSPPASNLPNQHPKRESILLVDHSGSMEGPKWEAADWTVKKFLSELTEEDFFNIGLFHNTTRWLYKSPRNATQATIREAIIFLESHKDSGGTELGVALEQALDQPRAKGNLGRHVLIITDAQVTDSDRILRLADGESKRNDKRRIRLVCIDAAPNSYLVLQIAERGGGIARFLTSSPKEEDITTALDNVLADWAEPVLTKVRLRVNRDWIAAPGYSPAEEKETGWASVDIGDLPMGRSLWVCGRVPADSNTDIKFQLTTADALGITHSFTDIPKGVLDYPTLKALFGARQILGLEHLIGSGYSSKELSDELQRLGYDAQTILSGAISKQRVYPENTRMDVVKALRKLLVSEALDYGLACSETGFVAVREEAGKQIEDSVFVANALPVGWSEEFLHAGSPGICYLLGPPPSSNQTYFALGAVDMYSKATYREISIPVFVGTPQFTNNEMTLFDSSTPQDSCKLPDSVNLTGIRLRFLKRTPKLTEIGSGLALLVFLDDMSSPVAKVPIKGFILLGETRPLNLIRRFDEQIKIVLVDPENSWGCNAPKIEVVLIAEV